MLNGVAQSLLAPDQQGLKQVRLGKSPALRLVSPRLCSRKHPALLSERIPLFKPLQTQEQLTQVPSGARTASQLQTPAIGAFSQLKMVEVHLNTAQTTQ